jgi:ABC-type bacteriocin/lantibiotic exporter with double-glycine peptidase domain
MISISSALVGSWLLIARASSIGRIVSLSVSHVFLAIIEPGIILGFIVFGEFLTTLFLAVFQGRFSATVASNIRNQAYSNLLWMKLIMLESFSEGDLISRFTRDIQGVQSLITLSFRTLANVLMFLFSSVYLLYTNFHLFLLTLVMMPISMLISNMITKRMRYESEAAAISFQKSISVLKDMLHGVATTKAFAAESQLIGRYQQNIFASMQNEISVSRVQSRVLFMTGVLRRAPYLIIIILGAYLVYLGQMTVGKLTSIYLLLDSVILNVPVIFSAFPRLRAYLVSLERLNKVMNAEVEQGMEAGNAVAVTHQGSFPEAVIDVQGVSFTYPPNGMGLKNVNLCIARGQKVAIIGASGSGKSTLLKVISGLYAPDCGMVSVCGVNPQTGGLMVRSLMDMLPQNAFLFPTTILENVWMANPDATKRQAMEAIYKSFQHEPVDGLADWSQTMVQERGGSLSGGQRQRVAFARTLLRQAPILLCDEPFSNLDQENEALMMSSLLERPSNATLILATHRIQTISEFDQIVVMCNGEVVECGTHTELMAAKGEYLRMIKLEMIS